VHVKDKKHTRVHSWRESRTALFWVIRHRVVAISYRRFGTNSRSHFQPFKMGSMGCPETSVINYH